MSLNLTFWPTVLNENVPEVSIQGGVLNHSSQARLKGLLLQTSYHPCGTQPGDFHRAQLHSLYGPSPWAESFIVLGLVGRDMHLRASSLYPYLNTLGMQWRSWMTAGCEGRDLEGSCGPHLGWSSADGCRLRLGVITGLGLNVGLSVGTWAASSRICKRRLSSHSL